MVALAEDFGPLWSHQRSLEILEGGMQRVQLETPGLDSYSGHSSFSFLLSFSLFPTSHYFPIVPTTPLRRPRSPESHWPPEGELPAPPVPRVQAQLPPQAPSPVPGRCCQPKSSHAVPWGAPVGAPVRSTAGWHRLCPGMAPLEMSEPGVSLLPTTHPSGLEGASKPPQRRDPSSLFIPTCGCFIADPIPAIRPVPNTAPFLGGQSCCWGRW